MGETAGGVVATLITPHSGVVGRIPHKEKKGQRRVSS